MDKRIVSHKEFGEKIILVSLSLLILSTIVFYIIWTYKFLNHEFSIIFSKIKIYKKHNIRNVTLVKILCVLSNLIKALLALNVLFFIHSKHKLCALTIFIILLIILFGTKIKKLLFYKFIFNENDPEIKAMSMKNLYLSIPSMFETEEFYIQAESSNDHSNLENES